MSDGVTATILGLGAGAWVYSRLIKTTNSTQNSLAGGFATGVVVLVVAFTFLKYVLHY